MISKVLKANSFYHTSRYVLQKEGAQVLLVEGVRGHDFKLMAGDFATQQQMRPDKETAGAHFILSFHPDEKPSDELMTRLAQEYLKRLGIVNTQFAIVKHTDKKHLHMHVIANMVGNDGKAISDSWIGLRGKKIAQQLTQEYKLIPALEKKLRPEHLEALNETEAVKYQIYETIAQSLPLCRTFEDLQRLLLKQGIETLYKYKGKTEEIQGISFRKGELYFKGSEIDRKFSYSNLKKILETQQREELSKQVKAPIRSVPAAPSPRQKKIITRSAFPAKATAQSHSSGNILGKLVEEVLKPVHDDGGSPPYELSQEAEIRRRKKKKRPSL
jgi:MobA/VirD2-like, nuclease domain